MRFMMLLKIDENTVPAGGPSPELMAEMGKLLDEMTKAGVLLDTAGLTPTAQGTRLHLSGGRITATDGPFTEAKEVIGGYALIQAASKEEAIEWATRFLRTHGDECTLTSEIRQVEEPPGAWLMATARNRAIDLLRRQERLARKVETLGRDAEREPGPSEAAFDRVLDRAGIEDDLLRLIFLACHPVLSTQARVALTLRLVGGLRTDEIARAFLTSEATVQQRIVRAKKRLVEAGVPFEVPARAEWGERLSSVLELNRAVAVGMAFGAEQGLAVVDGLAAEPALAGYHLLPSVRGDLLARLGRAAEAREEFLRAAALTRNTREQALQEERAAEQGEDGRA
ncbi:YciI family protein [Streptomyces sp. NEAU-L66]|uniref:YciI family protein n=1 Tax=Streptomyces sp. NEAU-L66 TaxID=3390812 RepID=UPI0039C71DCC